MADSGEDIDSRTAAVGASRSRSNPLSHHSDSSSRPVKKQRLSRDRDNRDVKDFVPRGATFSAQSLEVDPEETSSSGCSSDSSGDGETPTVANPNTGSTTPAINWNQGRKHAVRTTLGRPKASQPTTSQFNTVNDAFWRTRSASVSSEESIKDQDKGQDAKMDEADAATDSSSDDSDSSGSEVEKKARSSTATKATPLNAEGNPKDGPEDTQDTEDSEMEEGEGESASDSDDSVSLGSGEDAIMLNIGTDQKASDASANDSGGSGGKDGSLDAHIQEALADPSNGQPAASSKEEAFRAFAQKYPTAPVALVDLTAADLKEQSIFVYWDQKLETLDLQLPVGCVGCLRMGHLADICPTKECDHCGAWDLHTTLCCPTWRRCQRCRERGHDEEQCSSPLRSSAAEVPCDFCGSSYHLESDCSERWKYPMREATTDIVRVSISCMHCVSSEHLFGDCPSLPESERHPTFSLKGIDPDKIVNLSGPPRSAPVPPPRAPPRGPRRRQRGGRDSPVSSDTDEMPRGSRRPPPPARGNARGAIRFGSGVTSTSSRGRPQAVPPPQPRNPRGSATPRHARRNRGGANGNGNGNRGRGRGRGNSRGGRGG